MFTYWLSHGYVLAWLNLTTAPNGTFEELAYQFKCLRQSIKRHFGFPIEFLEVQTREGHGVIHAIIACQNPRFWVGQKWLSSEWERIHGARIVWIKRIGKTAADGKRLSKYIVTQYCAGQRGFVRFSWSWWLTPVKIRKAWKALQCLCSVTFQDPLAKWGWRREFMVSWAEILSTWDALLGEGWAMLGEKLLEVRSGTVVEVF